MKKIIAIITATFMAAGIFSACGTEGSPAETYEGAQIVLADSGITVDGAAISANTAQAVYAANDIIYYEEGHDFTYGEGTEADAHSKSEADAHTVVHITQPGQYVLSGKLSKGQIAVDLGDEAEENPEAVVTLVLNSLDITCEVAPAIIFYSVYECGEKDAEAATNNVDTSKAGANVIIADGSENTVTGAYVARIYKPDSVVLGKDGTEVEDAKKLHKYDAAFYSKMSMNVNGGAKGDGVLNINAENEGLDSELHLTVNGGNINIVSGNDGINTNEDYVSVTTVNGGSLNILVNGKTGEGDGIDSNGWLVINGGRVVAQACAFSGDAGIDSDMGIHINGGSVFATGNMLDRISESEQTFAVFSFAQSQKDGLFSLKNSDSKVVIEEEIANSFTYLIVSDEALIQGDYTLWKDGTQFEGTSTQGMGGHAGFKPGGEMPEDFSMPEGMAPPENFEEMSKPEKPEDMPEGMKPPEGFSDFSRPEMPEDIPEGMIPPEGFDENMSRPEGERPGGMQRPDGFGGEMGEASVTFTIKDGENYFFSVKPVE